MVANSICHAFPLSVRMAPGAGGSTLPISICEVRSIRNFIDMPLKGYPCSIDHGARRKNAFIFQEKRRSLMTTGATPLYFFVLIAIVAPVPDIRC